jgi:hypothetical protein
MFVLDAAQGLAQALALAPVWALAVYLSQLRLLLQALDPVQDLAALGQGRHMEQQQSLPLRRVPVPQLRLLVAPAQAQAQARAQVLALVVLVVPIHSGPSALAWARARALLWHRHRVYNSSSLQPVPARAPPRVCSILRPGPRFSRALSTALSRAPSAKPLLQQARGTKLHLNTWTRKPRSKFSVCMP